MLKTQRRPRDGLVSAWELLKESFENCRTNCNEYRRDIIAAHEALHPNYPSRNESSPQSNRYRSRVRLVEPKSLMPDRLGKKSGPSWRTWSYLARDFVGLVHSALKQPMKSAENRKQPNGQENQHLFVDGLKEKYWGNSWS